MKDRRGARAFFVGIALGAAGVLILIYVASFFAGVDFSDVFAGRRNFAARREIKEKSKLIGEYIEKYYLDDVDEDAMAASIYKGIVNGMGDEYGAYYTEDEYKDIVEKSRGIYCGIGAYVRKDEKTGGVVVVKPVKGGPAQKAGIRAGDVIRAVDGEEVAGEDLDDVLSKVKGRENTAVNLKIERGGQNGYLDIKVVRKVIKDDTVEKRMLDGDIGYVRVSGFEDVTDEQFDDAIDALEKEGMTSLIIDLRDNGGGLLSVAVTMLDRLLPKGLLTYTKDKNGVSEKYFAKDDVCVKVPMAVLVNENSASASEVFSGVLQDDGAAKLVGAKTFGKGIVQTIFAFDDGSALKMTTSKYYTPKGRNIHGTGLVPDIKAKYGDAEPGGASPAMDGQMRAAVEYLSAR